MNFSFDGALNPRGALKEEYTGNIKAVSAEPELQDFIDGPVKWEPGKHGGYLASQRIQI